MLGISTRLEPGEEVEDLLGFQGVEQAGWHRRDIGDLAGAYHGLADLCCVSSEGIDAESDSLVVLTIEAASHGGAVFFRHVYELELLVDEFGRFEDVHEEIVSIESGGNLSEIGTEDASGKRGV